jgi:hypothetical protein
MQIKMQMMMQMKMQMMMQMKMQMMMQMMMVPKHSLPQLSRLPHFPSFSAEPTNGQSIRFINPTDLG